MKLGVFMTGHFRDAPHTRENYARFLDNYDVSFYVATWSTYDINRQTHQLELQPVDVRGQMEAALGPALKGLWVGDQEKFHRNEPPTPGSEPRVLITDYLKKEDAHEYIQNEFHWPFIQRVSDQLYVNYEAYKLATPEEYESFDVCLRIRGDMRFIGKDPVPLDHLEDGIHTNSYWWTVQCEDSTGLSNPFRHGDHILWGKPKWMRKYFDYYAYYATHLVPLARFPHSVFQFSTEHLLALYLQRMPYFRQDLEWTWPIPNINERDCIVHKEGDPSKIDHHSGVHHPGFSFYEYYDILSKGIR